jgi:SAM-dependent methyltransferase
MATGDELDEIAKRAYEGLDDLWIEDACEEWIAPKIAEWCEGRVLDMGWGTGTMGKALLAAGVELAVIEGSQLLAVSALEAGVETVYQCLFEEATFARPFDTVLCLFVLEHVEDPVVVLERAYSWLKPGGRLIAAVPNATSLHRRVGALTTGQPYDTPSERDLLVGHVRVYDRRRLMADVCQAGFHVEVDRGWFHKPVWNALMVGWPPALIDALCQIGWVGPVEDAANLLLVARRP